ncbi:PIN domain-containing protein [Candidatus Peregrinibacteria bacterium]|jgi:tRNA(fMet)-specific endonuclease VapC|nr:PIN domain-containing protein [Candidatus Peregrinibacteria bacterium]
MYLLDTNHCIYLQNAWDKKEKKRNHFESSTLKEYNSLSQKICYMSEATYGELYYGVKKSNQVQKNLKRLNNLLYNVPAIEIDRSIWEIFGDTKAELSKNGLVIHDIDLVIASIAKDHNLILVAADKHMNHLPDDFKREDWTTNKEL